MAITISILLDTRRIKKFGKYPVKLRVTCDRKSEYYQTTFDVSQKDYNKLSASRISNELKAVRDSLKEIERAANNIIKDFESFSFETFESKFIVNNVFFKERKLKPIIELKTANEFDYSPFSKRFKIVLEDSFKQGTIFYSFSTYIKRLLTEGRIGTAVTYHDSYISLKKFRGNVTFKEVTVSYLVQYENWLKDQSVSKTTVGMYTRPLRALFNEAINDGIIKRENCYPFGARKYQIPSSINIKKSLDLNDVKAIYYYQCTTELENEKRARDFWLFSYFANGMNVKDIVLLKNKNIQGEYIVFERAKTERTLRTDKKPITVYITEDMKAIIDRWASKDKSPNNYLFPILELGISPLEQFETTLLFISIINSWMKKIMESLGIEKKATTYVARHTFSIVMKRSGASTEYIQEALGHTDIKTTENYLGSFEKEIKKEFADRLTAFKN